MSGGYTSTFNGTSSACPHAAGIAGLIFSADQTLSSESVKIIMEQSADNLGADGYDIQTGYGRLNAFNALTTIVSGPIIELSNNSIELNMNSDEITNTNITIYNTGEMDLEYSIDPYGYQSENSDINQNYSWIDISNNYETVIFNHNDNASDDIINFDFDFPFYNNNYSSLIVNPNGWIGFSDDNSEWYNTGLPNVEAPLNAIMPFWDDLNPNNSGNSTAMEGDVKYQINDNHLIIWYDNVRHWVGAGDIDGYYDFQVIISDNGNIDFNYRNMTGDTDSATIGIIDSDGEYGLEVLYNQDDFVQDELSVVFDTAPSWVNLTNAGSGQITSGNSEEFDVQINTDDLSNGSYISYIVIKGKNAGAFSASKVFLN